MKKTSAFSAAHPYFFCDFAATVCGLALFSYFVLTADRGVGIPDEIYHFTIPYRLLHGDAFLVHDWSIEQISQLPHVLPYFLFVKLTGGTEGLLLFARYFYICVSACFYFCVYRKLRKRIGYFGVLFAFLFCAVLPPTGLCLYYYNVGTMAMTLLCLTLFPDTERKSAGKLFAAGFLWGIAILAEPMTALSCVLFSLVVLARVFSARRKKPLLENYSFIFSPRALGWLALGAFTVLLLFVSAVLFTGGGPETVRKTLPYFLGTSGYSGAGMFDFWKIPDVISLYGVPGLLLGFVSLWMALSDRKKRKAFRAAGTKNKKNKRPGPDPRRRIAAFAVSCAGFALCTLWAARCLIGPSSALIQQFFVYQNFPLLLFSLVWVLLCETDEPNVLMIWWTGFLFSLFADISSDVSLGIGGPVALLAGVTALRRLLTELKDGGALPRTKNEKKRRPGSFARPVAVSVAVLAVSAALGKGGYIAAERLLTPAERIFGDASEKLCAVIGEGPYRGVVTTAHVKEAWEATLRDLSRIREENTENAPVMVAGICPAAYQVLGAPVGCSSAFYETKDYALQQDYWAMFPEKLPAFIYIPDYSYYSYRDNRDADKRQDLSLILPAGAEYDVTEGEVGRIAALRR